MNTISFTDGKPKNVVHHYQAFNKCPETLSGYLSVNQKPYFPVLKDRELLVEK